MKRWVLFVALALSACNKQPAGEPVMRAELGKASEEAGMPKKALSACNPATFEGAQFTHCVADPDKHRIRMALNGEDGIPYRSLPAFEESLGTAAAGVAFAMNGGMLGSDGLPIGYYVEDGERLRELNRDDGSGNFYLKPNGVFFGTDGAWRIMDTESFFAKIGDRPEFGTQSGPMLVIEGKLHPEIAEDGPSKGIRNAVGVDTIGKAHFVISETPVSFGVIARYFRDELKTPNALFLDGAISALWDPSAKRIDTNAALGPIIVVTSRE